MPKTYNSMGMPNNPDRDFGHLKILQLQVTIKESKTKVIGGYVLLVGSARVIRDFW